MIWKYTKTDGNPTQEDEYAVVILHPEAIIVRNGKAEPAPNTKTIARGEFRFFGRHPQDPLRSYAMCDQNPNAEMYWQEGEDSHPCETVYAWLDTSGMSYPELPEGVEWRD